MVIIGELFGVVFGFCLFILVVSCIVFLISVLMICVLGMVLIILFCIKI